MASDFRDELLYSMLQPPVFDGASLAWVVFLQLVGRNIG